MLRKLVFGSLAALAVLTIPSFAQEKSAAAPAAGKKACATCEAKTTVAAAIRCEKCAKEAAPCAACQERATLVKSLPDPTCAAQKVLDSCPKCKEMGKFCCGGCEGKATACKTCAANKDVVAKISCADCKGKAQCADCVAKGKAITAACPECALRTAAKDHTCMVCAVKKAGETASECSNCKGKSPAELCEKCKATVKAIEAVPDKAHKS
ncbi:MAG TPA: hypothetical protein VKF62_07820 [Planctomycetota bacterium]|nr:hypothetical protein [Planctomycetota bacterium]